MNEVMDDPLLGKFPGQYFWVFAWKHHILGCPECQASKRICEDRRKLFETQLSTRKAGEQRAMWKFITEWQRA